MTHRRPFDMALPSSLGLFLALNSCGPRVASIPDSTVVAKADGGSDAAWDIGTDGSSDTLIAIDSPETTAADSPHDAESMDLADALPDSPNDSDGSCQSYLFDIDVASSVSADAATDVTSVTGAVYTWAGIPLDASCATAPIMPVTKADSGCTTECPAPYPCVCGTCGWLPTPHMLIPRRGHRAVWTGKWVVVVGGYYPGLPMDKGMVTGERWNPKGCGGFEEIPISDGKVTKNGINYVIPIWTGKEVFIFPQYPVPPRRYNPETNKMQMLDFTVKNNFSYWDVIHFAAGKFVFTSETVRTLDPETEVFSDLPFPTSELIDTDGLVYGNDCATAQGDDYYLYDPIAGPDGLHWKNGLPAGKTGVILKLHVPTSKWTLLPAAIPDTLRCEKGKARVAIANGYLYAAKTVMGPTLAMARMNLVTGVWSDVAVGFYSYMEDRVQPWLTVGTSLLCSNVKWQPDGTKSTVYDQEFFSPIVVGSFAAKAFRTPPFGQPIDQRNEVAVVATDSDIYVLGGVDGPPDVLVVHSDGIRFPLAPVLKGELP